MSITVAVVAQGSMGAGVGAALAKAGATVITSLEGRSAHSAARASAANMQPASDPDMAQADFILSIVPPGDALAFAQRMAPHLRMAGHKAVFADLNAVNPDTAKIIAHEIEPTGARFVDGGIIGTAPKEGYTPAIYCSGANAPAMAALRDYGLDIRVMEGDVGAASALKMSYGGISKGLTALSSAMMLASVRAGADHDLRDELARSQPQLTAWFERQTPAMYPKAYRWVAEMREISQFVAEDPAASDLFEAIAKFYERMAADHAGAKAETGALAAFLGRKPGS